MLGLDSKGATSHQRDYSSSGLIETSLWSFKGRIGRGDFWERTIAAYALSFAAAFAVGSIAGAITHTRGDAQAVSALFFVPLYIALVWFALATQAKRWHDLNQSGWMILLNFTIIAIPFTLVYTGFFKGTEGPNRFGADPVG